MKSGTEEMINGKIMRTAASAGFCFGVSTAVKKLQEAVDHGKKPIYTWGPIIHNDHVIRQFEEQGVKVLKTKEELEQVKEGTVVIRSHGTTREIIRILESNGVDVIDGTCPFVSKIHRIVEEQGGLGKDVIIIGKASHPEVEGILGWCSGPAQVLETKEDVECYVPTSGREVCVVSQTTFHIEKFKNFIDILEKKVYYINVLNTICSATEKRQKEAGELSGEVDAMIVIGDLKSSNTQKLFEICKAECNNTYLVETATEIVPSWFTEIKSIGVTAGASTPNNIIEEVQNNVRSNF